LLSALQAIDPSSDLLLPLLTVISNATAHPANQVLMRDIRITEKVTEMICSPRGVWSRSCRIMLLQCLANMAVCIENYPIVRCVIPYAVQRLSLNDETEVVVAFQALTNLSLNISQEEVLRSTYCIMVSIQDPNRNPASTLYYAIYGSHGRKELEKRSRELTLYNNVDIANKAVRLIEILENVNSNILNNRFSTEPFMTVITSSKKEQNRDVYGRSNG
ncbi:hypothetical protein DICVIV_09492, partial [Dictyocaulus viviparus]